MKLNKFAKNTKRTRIAIGCTIGLILLIGAISFYKTFALYEETKEFNVLKGRVPDFRKTFSDYIIEKRRIDSSIIKFFHLATEQTPALTDYRYVGKNPNNYVCFGSEDSVCPEDNLYRVVGVMPIQSSENGIYENRVKLFKYRSYLKTNGDGLNNWKYSTYYTLLNDTFWNTLEEYQNYIEDAKWYLGVSATVNTIEELYNNERSGNNYSINKIALLNVSDYGFSTNRDTTTDENICITSDINKWSNDCATNSWIYEYKGTYSAGKWLLTPSPMKSSWMILEDYSTYTGKASYSGATSYGMDYHPTYYLKANVMYKSGSGSLENPYRVTFY